MSASAIFGLLVVYMIFGGTLKGFIKLMVTLVGLYVVLFIALMMIISIH